MPPLAIEAGAGAVLAALLIWRMRRRGRARERRAYGTWLLVAALVYVGFAFTGIAPPVRVGLEVAGAALFAPVAIAARARPAWLLAAGWAAHVAWDLTLHPRVTTGYWPPWYPGLCVGFDLLLAGYVLLRFRDSGPPAT
jgi:hypothetical protein